MQNKKPVSRGVPDVKLMGSSGPLHPVMAPIRNGNLDRVKPVNWQSNTN